MRGKRASKPVKVINENALTGSNEKMWHSRISCCRPNKLCFAELQSYQTKFPLIALSISGMANQL